MTLPLFQVDAFGNGLFSGNPACVCPLDNWLDDEILQKIAAENNVPETAFFTPNEKGYHLRWFTPRTEIHLCGHATLASAFVLFNHLNQKRDLIRFDTLSGELKVRKDKGLLTLDFPLQKLENANLDEDLIRGLGVLPREGYKTDYLFLVFENEDQIRDMKPDFEALKKSNEKGVLVTAKSKSTDYVFRFFAPKLGIPEDPATGSAQTMLMPYWADRLNKKDLNSVQLSERKGYFSCRLVGERVMISGEAHLYSQGSIEI
jgi:PhzF family phenazine biosynthesis protein